MFDWLIVGAGVAGSVLAERLARLRNERVMVIDRRPHIGGNAYDHLDAAGLLIHRYGPHIFHTNSQQVFDHLSRFTAWRPYEHRVLAEVRQPGSGAPMRVPMPINLDTINRLYGLALSESEVEAWLAARAETVPQIRTSEDVVVSKVGRELYELFFRGYTRKQWALDPSELDKSVTARVPTRTNRDDRYFTDTFQAMPKDGYTRMFERMLAHPNITVRTNTLGGTPGVISLNTVSCSASNPSGSGASAGATSTPVSWAWLSIPSSATATRPAGRIVLSGALYPATGEP